MGQDNASMLEAESLAHFSVLQVGVASTACRGAPCSLHLARSPMCPDARGLACPAAPDFAGVACQRACARGRGRRGR
jgi:hypothetical protein